MSKDLRLRLVDWIIFLSGNHNSSYQQAELSKEEMKQSVPSLIAKIANNRPLVVCFVGKIIWTIVEAVLKKQMLDAGTDPGKSCGTADHMNHLDSGEFPAASPNRKITRRRTPMPNTFEWGLQPYKLAYPDTNGRSLTSLLH